ncbi:MAG TPA: ATP-dependent RNA helicase [Cytophagales bacterium]|nr:ATP-dependent RNA helicase [Cytophagales bacterium]
MKFEEFNLSSALLDGLNAMGFTQPTPIQEQAIPSIMAGKDIVASAQTGTGKTAAYLLPILDKISKQENHHINTLILVPTRELALQIDQQVEGFGYFLNASSISVYGGGSGAIWDQQRKALESGADIIIATPGRLIAHLASGTVNFKHIEHLVLDEADRMLDMGFYEDLIKIVSHLPVKRQTLMFSATMPPRIRTLANKILIEPEQISISISKPAEGILQQAYMVYDTQKVELLTHLLNQEHYSSIIIFASTKDNVKKLESVLRRNGISVKAFHSDLEQQEREHIMREFKSKKISTIIGTDILSRGIDVEGIDLVVNFDAPPDPEDYIHRIGRTARAQRTGTAITFVNDKDQQKFASIEKLIGREIPKEVPPMDLGETPVYNPGAKRKPSFGKRRPPFRNQKGRRPPKKN